MITLVCYGIQYFFFSLLLPKKKHRNIKDNNFAVNWLNIKCENLPCTMRRRYRDDPWNCPHSFAALDTSCSSIRPNLLASHINILRLIWMDDMIVLPTGRLPFWRYLLVRLFLESNLLVRVCVFSYLVCVFEITNCIQVICTRSPGQNYSLYGIDKMTSRFRMVSDAKILIFSVITSQTDRFVFFCGNSWPIKREPILLILFVCFG